MPQRPGETNEAWMDRIRAARGLGPQREELMGRTRAAVGYINATDADEGVRMSGFLAIFHPELGEARRQELVRAARDEGRHRRGGRR